MVKTKLIDVPSEQLCNSVVAGMLERKAFDVVVMDLRAVKNAIADFFVLCSGNSDTQIDAIADSIDEQVFKNTQQNPWHREGREAREWILLDYVDVVAHVFKKDRRDYYKLEDLWGDAHITRVEEATLAQAGQN